MIDTEAGRIQGRTIRISPRKGVGEYSRHYRGIVGLRVSVHVRSKHRRCILPRIERRYVDLRRLRQIQACPLVGEEEECPVLAKRAAKYSAEIVVVLRSPWVSDSIGKPI